MSNASLVPALSIRSDSGELRVKLSKASLQHMVASVATFAVGAARRLEERRSALPPVETAREATEALETAERLVEAAVSEAAALDAAVAALSGEQYDAAHVAHPAVTLAADAFRIADELRAIDPESLDADLSATLTTLSAMRDQLHIDVDTAQRRLNSAQREVRRLNGAAMAALATATERAQFADLSLDTLLPDDWPKHRGAVTVADVDAAKQRVADAVALRRIAKHEQRQADRRQKTSAALERLDRLEAERAKLNAAAVRQIAEVMHG